MKTFFKKILVFCGIIAAFSTTTNLVNQNPTYARTFLGMPSWDDGVSLDTEKNQDQLKTDIVKIAANILTDITVIAAYLVLGYVIWGGYQYMFSSGDPGKAAAGKKTLQHAFIGLGIVLSAYVIFGAIRVALIGNQSLDNCSPVNGCITADSMIINLIQWVVGISGVVAAIFIVVGAWGYITSAGDPNKLQKAKTTILYALIGLVIVALAEILTAFISGIIRDANGEDVASIQNALIINKENTK